MLNAELQFADFLEHLPTPAYACAPDGTITRFNKHALRLWGREPSLNSPSDRFCGSLQIFSTTGEPIPHDQCYMALTLATGTECTGQEIVIQCADGRRVAILAHAKPVHDKTGRIIGAVGILVDISAQNDESQSLHNELLHYRSLEQKFFAYSEREQSRLTHHLHEDLGQQLTGIALLVRVLGRRLSEESHAEVDKVIELARLTSESIATARNLAKGSYPLELDHGGLIPALEELAHRTVTKFKISCEIQHDESFRYEQDAGIHLYRIAQEVINNAIKRACARNIVVECKTRDDAASLTVTTDGIPFKYLLTKPNGIDFDLIHSRARLIGGHIELRDCKIGSIVICWLNKRHIG